MLEQKYPNFYQKLPKKVAAQLFSSKGKFFNKAQTVIKYLGYFW